MAWVKIIFLIFLRKYLQIDNTNIATLINIVSQSQCPHYLFEVSTPGLPAFCLTPCQPCTRKQQTSLHVSLMNTKDHPWLRLRHKNFKPQCFENSCKIAIFKTCAYFSQLGDTDGGDCGGSQCSGVCGQVSDPEPRHGLQRIQILQRDPLLRDGAGGEGE